MRPTDSPLGYLLALRDEVAARMFTDAAKAVFMSEIVPKEQDEHIEEAALGAFRFADAFIKARSADTATVVHPITPSFIADVLRGVADDFEERSIAAHDAFATGIGGAWYDAACALRNRARVIEEAT